MITTASTDDYESIGFTIDLDDGVNLVFPGEFAKDAVLKMEWTELWLQHHMWRGLPATFVVSEVPKAFRVTDPKCWFPAIDNNWFFALSYNPPMDPHGDHFVRVMAREPNEYYLQEWQNQVGLVTELLLGYVNEELSMQVRRDPALQHRFQRHHNFSNLRTGVEKTLLDHRMAV